MSKVNNSYSLFDWSEKPLDTGYEIVAMINNITKALTYYKDGEPHFCTDDEVEAYPLENLMENQWYDIHTVRRLIDNQEFRLGQETNKGKITSFRLSNECYAMCDNSLAIVPLNKLIDYELPF